MIKIISTIFIAILICFGMRHPADALTLSPPTTETTAKPGENVKITAKLYNEGNTTAVVKPGVLSFRAKNEDGQPDFFDDPTKTDLQYWITLPQQVILAPKERQTLVVNIAVPRGADPGGHYAAVFWGSESPDVVGTGTGIQGRIAMLILVNVEGKVIEDAKVIEFSTKNKILTHLPSEFVVRFQNNGTIHVHPAGSITIRNFLGRNSAVLPFNIQPSTGNILPKSIRRFDLVWLRKAVDDGVSEWKNELNNFALGRYTAQLVATYGPSNKAVVETTVFWVFPWMLMMAGTAALAVALMILLFLVRGYNRYIIRKYARNEFKK